MKTNFFVPWFFLLETTETKVFQLKNDVHVDAQKLPKNNEAEPKNLWEIFNQLNGITICEAHQWIEILDTWLFVTKYCHQSSPSGPLSFMEFQLFELFIIRSPWKIFDKTRLSSIFGDACNRVSNTISFTWCMLSRIRKRNRKKRAQKHRVEWNKEKKNLVFGLERSNCEDNKRRTSCLRSSDGILWFPESKSIWKHSVRLNFPSTPCFIWQASYINKFLSESSETL